MLGGFVGRTLLLAFGYAYPAFRCFKTVEKNRVGIEELRFWCQYWIIMALVTIVERFADTLISWLPFYGELKLALVIYLWHPKFSGTGSVYDNVLRPFVAKHENDIDRSLSEMRAWAWDTTVLYGQYVAEMGQAVFLQALSYLAAHSQKLPQINTSRVTKKQDKMRRPSPKELSTPRSARLNRASPVNRSVSGFPGSDAADTTPNAQTTDFVCIEEHELEEAARHDMHNRPTSRHKSHLQRLSKWALPIRTRTTPTTISSTRRTTGRKTPTNRGKGPTLVRSGRGAQPLYRFQNFLKRPCPFHYIITILPFINF